MASRGAARAAGRPEAIAIGPAAGPGQWIVGARYDQLFLWAAWCVPLVLTAIAYTLPYGLLVALVSFVLLDNSHQVATLPLTVFDPYTMRRAAPVYLGGAAAIAVAAVAISTLPDSARIFTSIVLYWGAWHIIRQHYGFLRLYQARDKPDDPRLAKAEVVALYSGASFPYFLNLAHGWAARGVEQLVYEVPIPSWSPWIVLSVFGASLAYVLADAVRRGLAGRGIVTRRLLHIVLVVSNFWLGLLWFGRENLILAVLFITSYHDLQYHAVVWHVGRRRIGMPESVRPAVRRMFGSMGLFVAVILAGAVVQSLFRNEFRFLSSMLPESAATAALFAVFTSYSYMHYFFDGKMWKLSTDPRLRAELGLGAKTAPAT